nr:immunoglobulin light chain junction region [Macaca mulatta]
CLHYKSYPPTF